MDATPLQTALAWLLRRSPNILLIPGTIDRAPARKSRRRVLDLPDDAMDALNGIASGAKSH